MLAPVVAGPDDTRYRRPRTRRAHQKPPEVIRAVSGAMLEIDRIGVPPALLAALKHLASLHNPDYYEKERLRFSTWNTPRFLRCYGETIDHLHLPRGIADQAVRMVADAGSNLEVVDTCSSPSQSTSPCRPTSRIARRAHWTRSSHTTSGSWWPRQARVRPSSPAQSSPNFGSPRSSWSIDSPSSSNGENVSESISAWPPRKSVNSVAAGTRRRDHRYRDGTEPRPPGGSR